MATVDKLGYLLETKNQIKDAISQKGVSITDTDSFRSYANKIRQIESNEGSVGSSTKDWKPQPDWWDIETILENDTEDYSQKIICLLTDELDDGATKNTISGFEKYKLSDGQIIEQLETTSLDISDLFDKQKDKTCQKGYKTRYIICYRNTTDYINFNIPNNTIYTIFSNLKYFGNPWYSKYYLQALKLINNCQRSGNSFSTSFRACFKLQLVEGLDTSDNKDFSEMFSNCYELRTAPNIDTSKGKDFKGMYKDCHGLKEILQLDISNATILEDIINNCYTLTIINNIGTIKTSLKVNSNYLSHTSLLNLLYSLEDLTDQATQELILGNTNLAKLTEEEKAIATEKNWTLA